MISRIGIFQKIFSVALLLFLFSGCSTDIDILAPKKDITVIYGLLDVSETRHYIRINKSFAGEESASEMAARPGINEYKPSELSAIVLELDDSGNITNNWPLTETYINTKEEGNFASDSNKVYYFDAQLNPGRTYRIECTVTPEGEETKNVSAETTVIDASAIFLTSPALKPTEGCGPTNRDEARFVSSNDYLPSYEVTWRPDGANGRFYKSYFYAYYTTYNSNNMVVSEDSIRFDLGTTEIGNSGTTKDLTFVFDTEVFFDRIANEVPDMDPVDGYRNFQSKLQFYLEVANNELATYMSVSRPTTGIVQERPEYTNVTNGHGIFGSRYIASTRKPADIPPQCDGRILAKATIEELLFANIAIANGEEGTLKKGFCNEKVAPCPF